MKPAAGKRLVAGGLVLEIALHHHIAAEHDFAERGPVARHWLHAVRIEHVERLERQIAHALARFLCRLLRRIELVPFGMPVVHHRRAVGLGQPVKMRDVEAGLFHRGQHGFRRRRRGGEELHHMRQRLLLARGRVQQGRHHDRRAAQMRHLVGGDQVVHGGRAHRAQANMRADHGRDRPGEAPAVAMEHRQRPQINRVLAHAAGQHIALRQQIRAAMVIDHALRVAGGA